MNLLVGITLGFALFVFADLALDWIVRAPSSNPQSKHLPRK